MKNQKIKDPDIDKAGTALKRAAKRAREIARRTGTPLVTYKDGHIVKEQIPHIEKQ